MEINIHVSPLQFTPGFDNKVKIRARFPKKYVFIFSKSPLLEYLSYVCMYTLSVTQLWFGEIKNELCTQDVVTRIIFHSTFPRVLFHTSS